MPKAYISYSWTTPEHEQWVLRLAEQLMGENGVEVVLDKWHLAKGADKHVFMEKMVNDPSITKVVCICDRGYAAKANDRKGGVGTETQIITPELYDQFDKTAQEQKFVPVVVELDDDSKPYLPTFFKNRIYVDMTPEREVHGLEELLRWLYDKPLHRPPVLGKPPAFLTAEDALNLGTSSRQRRALEALREGRQNATAAVRDYFETLAENMERLRIEPEDGQELDDQVVESLKQFLPYRDEAVEVFLAIARYQPTEEMAEAVHSFFEQVLPLGYAHSGMGSWREGQFDNLRFIVHELFLYYAAALLKEKRFELFDYLVRHPFYVNSDRPELDRGETGAISFVFFRSYCAMLEERRNKRLNLRRLSVTADLFEERAKRTDLTFEHVKQADFVLYLRYLLQDAEGQGLSRMWYPYTLLYTHYQRGPFEIFARAASKRYFARAKIALGVESGEELRQLFRREGLQLPRWEFHQVNPGFLGGLERLDTVD